MKRVLVTAAGGAPGLGFTRSLRESPEEFYIVGVDADKYNLQRAECDARYLVPRSDDPLYSSVIARIILDERIQFLHVQVSSEVLAISSLRDEFSKLGVRTFLPKHETIEVCEDKWRSHQVWHKAGLRVPASVFIRNEDDLNEAFHKLGPRIWLREIRGSAGRGSLPTTDFSQAKAWIDFRKGWGIFQASEYLGEESVTWQAIWNQGELVVAQGRRRLYWEAASRAPSGVTGITGTGVTVSDETVDSIAREAILAIDAQPHGVFGVDLTYDKYGFPNPTEINSGRFFTTHHFFTKAGLNMPYILVKLAFGEPPPTMIRAINPLPPGLAWVRGMDIVPVFTNTKTIETFQVKLSHMIKELSSDSGIEDS